MVYRALTKSDIEEIFDKFGASLFPKSSKDIKTECSCPDWSNPCKHIAAVLYLLAEEFDRDAFLILKLRGLEREELMSLIDKEADGIFSYVKQEQIEKLPGIKRKKTGETKDEKNGKPQKVKTQIADKNIKEPSEKLKEQVSEPLRTDTGIFWNGTDETENTSGEIQKPQINAALPKRLGNFPFWRGNEQFLKIMETIYTRASESSTAV